MCSYLNNIFLSIVKEAQLDKIFITNYGCWRVIDCKFQKSIVKGFWMIILLYNLSNQWMHFVTVLKIILIDQSTKTAMINLTR